MVAPPMTKGQRRARILAAAVVVWIAFLVTLIALGYGRADAASAVVRGIGPVAQHHLREVPTPVRVGAVEVDEAVLAGELPAR